MVDQISNGETGLSVRTKLNTALMHTGGNTFATRAAAVTAIGDGSFVPVNGVSYIIGDSIYTGSTGATDISDLPGLVPFGDVTPDHFKENTTPGTTDMVDAIESAASYGSYVNIRLRGVTYAVSRAPVIRGHTVLAVPEPVVIVGEGQGLSVIRPLTNSADGLVIEKSATNNSGWVTPTLKGFTISYSGAVKADGGTGLTMRRCLNGDVELEVSGAPYSIDLQNVGQVNFKVYTNGTNAAGALGTVWKFHSTAYGRCFGNKLYECEHHQGQTHDITFHLLSVDTLNISDSHFNNGTTDVLIDVDGVDLNDTVRQLYIDNTYFDGNGSPEDSIIIQAPNVGTAAVIDGLYFTNTFWRVGGDASTPGSVLRVAQGIGDLDGLDRISRIIFNGCEFRQFEGRYINLDSPNYDMTSLVSYITIVDCLINDGPAGSAAANLNAIVVAGQFWTIRGCTISGAWTNSTEYPISVSAESEDVLISECVFDTTKTADVIINASAVNVRSWDHLKTGGTGTFPTVKTENGTFYPCLIADEGTNADGYYRQYSDGRLLCRKTVSFTTTAITTAYGSLFRSGVLSLGNWPATFGSAPESFISLTYPSVFAGHGGFTTAPTTTAVGNTFVFAPTSIASGAFDISVIAEGTV